MKTQSEMANLISLCISMLKSMQLPTSLFCFERVKGVPGLHGSSVRYTLITLVGLLRAEKCRYETYIDTREILTAILALSESNILTPGDLGLCLWADAELGSRNHARLIGMLRHRLNSSEDYLNLTTMEVAWIIIGIVLTLETIRSSTAQNILEQALNSFYHSRVSPTGLFYHYGNRCFRSRFPNFASQIYGVLAMSHVAEYLHDRNALHLAVTVADRLLFLQLPFGAWPWLYDTRTGRVVERYEIYSVHQDAMAPMALFKLSQVCKDIRYGSAALKGLDWIYGFNELKVRMIDEVEGMIYRSIRRRKPFNKLMLYANNAMAVLTSVSDFACGRFLEVNQSVRPYHLGWVLYAWCGNEDMGAFSAGS